MQHLFKRIVKQSEGRLHTINLVYYVHGKVCMGTRILR